MIFVLAYYCLQRNKNKKKKTFEKKVLKNIENMNYE